MKKEPLCLTVDQMHYLINTFNVDTDNASLRWVEYEVNGEPVGYECIVPIPDSNIKKPPYILPAFTLADILKLLPHWQLSTVTDGYIVTIMPDHNFLPGASYPKAKGNTLLSAAYNALCLALRKGYI